MEDALGVGLKRAKTVPLEFAKVSCFAFRMFRRFQATFHGRQTESGTSLLKMSISNTQAPPSVRYGSLRERRCRRPITLFMSFGTKPPADIKRSLSYAVRSCSLATRRLVPRTPTSLVRDGYLIEIQTIK